MDNESRYFFGKPIVFGDDILANSQKIIMHLYGYVDDFPPLAAFMIRRDIKVFQYNDAFIKKEKNRFIVIDCDTLDIDSYDLQEVIDYNFYTHRIFFR